MLIYTQYIYYIYKKYILYIYYIYKEYILYYCTYYTNTLYCTYCACSIQKEKILHKEAVQIIAQKVQPLFLDKDNDNYVSSSNSSSGSSNNSMVVVIF